MCVCAWACLVGTVRPAGYGPGLHGIVLKYCVVKACDLVTSLTTTCLSLKDIHYPYVCACTCVFISEIEQAD